MIDLDNQTTLTVHLELLENIANSLSTKEIELIIVDDNTMQRLNNQHRGKNTITDVLSFPIETPFNEATTSKLPLGSIVISSEFVKEKAKIYNHTTQDELMLLFIHGLLHLLGYDHETDNGEMRAKEQELIKYWNLPESLIVRTEES